MKSALRTIGMTLALSFVGAATTFAADAAMGTWKLNDAKSKFAEGAAKNTTVMYEAAGDSVKVTIEGLDSKGAATHSEWTGKFDGQDYAVTGDPNSDMRSVHAGQRQPDGLHRQERRQGRHDRTHRRHRRWHAPNRHDSLDRCEGQEVHHHGRVRQAVAPVLPFRPPGRKGGDAVVRALMPRAVQLSLYTAVTPPS